MVMEEFGVGIMEIVFALLNIGILVGIIFGVYFLIKRAVKKGVYEAMEKYKNDNENTKI